MPHLLELFAGTKSVGKVFEAAGWRVTSVDLLPRFLPTICMDVMDLDVSNLVGDVDLMWASPPCTHYSRARTCAKTPRDLEGSDRMVQKCLDIAAQLGCPYFMENPHTGLLKGRAVVAGIPYRVVDYCKYHDHRCTHRAQKRTAIWTNTDWMPSRSLCLKDCGHCEGNRHLDYAQTRDLNGYRRHTRDALYAIPPLLVEDIFEWAHGQNYARSGPEWLDPDEF